MDTLIDNGDGTFSDPITGDLFDDVGNFLDYGTPAGDTIPTDGDNWSQTPDGFWLNSVTGEVTDEFGNLVETVSLDILRGWNEGTIIDNGDGTWFEPDTGLLLDSAGNVIGFDWIGMDKGDAPADNTPRKTTGNGSSIGVPFGGSTTTPGKDTSLDAITKSIAALTQLITQAQRNNAPTSQLSALQSSLAKAQAAQTKATGGIFSGTTGTLLIVAGAALGFFALSRNRAA